jgi:hypothetical protein
MILSVVEWNEILGMEQDRVRLFGICQIYFGLGKMSTLKTYS